MDRFDSSFLISFFAEDIDQADEIIDELIEDLEDRGFDVDNITVSESVRMYE